jgi:predicted unusual protein kinase regulating ubiquinone biosynthesis (AarF/ABC1/UbiB family)
VNELKVFLDAVTPRPVAEMLEVLERSMGKPVREVFEWFDAMPIASASLSQVHLARTRDGHDVAVKIQYPGIREIMMNDMRTSHNFSKRFNPEMSEAADEAERQFEMEFDFTMEADNIRAIHANMQALEDKCMVPYPLFASREVLMMTLVPGVPILKDTRSHEEQAQTYHNILVAMGKQILVDGVFNGDPHPGNFFALPDGRAGLLDFGQVKTLPDDLRLKFAKLMLALAENANDEEITECVLALGFRWKNNIPQYVAGFTRFNFNSARWESLGDGKNPMQVIGEAMKNDPLVRLPGDMTFLFRATTLLRGICYQFPGLVIADVWKPYAQQALAAGPRVSIIQEVGSSA